MGRKRHILGDTLGLILAVVVDPANIQECNGARLVLEKLTQPFGWLANCRRFAKDYEYHPANSEALILIAASKLVAALLAK